MSEVNLEFTVGSNPITITVDPNEITFTPTDVQLTLSTAGLALPATPLNSVQFNKQSKFTGSNNFTYDDSNNVLTLGNLVLNNNASINNVSYLSTDVSNIHITGGTNGYVLQTDGVGNLSWTAQTGNGGGGNGSPGGANTQIQYNDSGLFNGNAGFTFNEITGNVNIPGNLSVVGNISGSIANANYANYAGNVVISSQPNITSLGNLTGLTVTGLSSIQEAKEKVTLNGTGATGTINFDVLSQAIIYNTANATSNFVLNIRGNSSTTLNTVMSTGESMTLMFINTNGSTPYIISDFQIDGSSVTPNWLYPTGAPGAGIANSKETYNINIVKTGTGAFTVLMSRTVYQ